MARKQEYDWIDDPFKEEKEQEKRGMSTQSKAFVGLGCLAVLVVIVVLFVMVIGGLQSALSAL